VIVIVTVVVVIVVVFIILLNVDWKKKLFRMNRAGSVRRQKRFLLATTAGRFSWLLFGVADGVLVQHHQPRDKILIHHLSLSQYFFLINLITQRFVFFHESGIGRNHSTNYS